MPESQLATRNAHRCPDAIDLLPAGSANGLSEIADRLTAFTVSRRCSCHAYRHIIYRIKPKMRITAAQRRELLDFAEASLP